MKGGRPGRRAGHAVPMSASDTERSGAAGRSLRRIRVFSDGRPGHENQSLGLAEALSRRTGAEVECRRLPDAGGPPLRWWWAMRRAGPAPDLIIGAGHKTHLALWLAARRFRARSVVIMKPTWPMFLFDLCLVPRHDLGFAGPGSRVIPTRGALNRIPEDLPPKQPRGLILLGGPSRTHDWAGETLIGCVAEVVAARPELRWAAADSRRTPAGFLHALVASGLPLEPLPRDRTSTRQLLDHLLVAEEVWVTADSVSMAFEAVTAGARVGLLPAPVRDSSGGPVRALQELVADGYATLYAAWRLGGRSLPPPRRLHETARCADLVLDRLFPGTRR